MQMKCTIEEEVCVAQSVPDWISNLFLHEVALRHCCLRNNSVLFLRKVHLGGWSQYEAHCKHANLVPTTEIKWKKTFSWSNEGLHWLSYHNFPFWKSNYFVWNNAGICQGILVMTLIRFSLSLIFADSMKLSLFWKVSGMGELGQHKKRLCLVRKIIARKQLCFISSIFWRVCF